MNVRYTPSSPRSEDPCAVPLAGAHGELLTISIAAEPRDLEDLLDRLAQSQYPIDPQIYHDAHVNGRPVTLVEFPAYPGWLDEVRRLVDGREELTIRHCYAAAAS